MQEKKKNKRLYSFICHSEKDYMSVLDCSTNYAALELLKNTSFEHAIIWHDIRKLYLLSIEHELGIKTDNGLQYATYLKVFKMSRILRMFLHSQVRRNWWGFG